MTMSSAAVTVVSGYGAKSPACFLVEIHGRRFLLDLGEEPSTGRVPDLSQVGNIDAVLISHGHADHVGGLRHLARIGCPPVYASAMVRALGDLQLQSARELPLRGGLDIAGIEIETGRSGHAPGAVWMRIGGPRGVLYSGDFSREGALYAFDIPPQARCLIVDASYGTYDDPLEPVVDALVDAADRTPLLLPTQPNGRGLEMAILLHERGIPIALCPAHVEVARIILENDDGELSPGAAKRVASMLAGTTSLESITASRGAIMAANGSATSGLAAALLQQFAGLDGARVIFSSRPGADTPGTRAITAGRAKFLRWNVHPRLRDLRWLIDCVDPEKILPAFLPHDKIEELRDALAPSVLARDADK